MYASALAYSFVWSFSPHHLYAYELGEMPFAFSSAIDCMLCSCVGT